MTRASFTSRLTTPQALQRSLGPSPLLWQRDDDDDGGDDDDGDDDDDDDDNDDDDDDDDGDHLVQTRSIASNSQGCAYAVGCAQQQCNAL